MSRSSIPTKRPGDAQEAAWVADEDRFVLQQTKKKALLRARAGRADPIDWLAVTLALLDPQHNQMDDEVDDSELDLVDPEAVFENLNDAQLKDLASGITSYLILEKSRTNREYWTMMKTICDNQAKSSQGGQRGVRGVDSVASDLDRLLGPKSLDELEKLEKQINAKLASNEPIDTDYWEHLRKSLLTYKARAKLRNVSQSIIDARLGALCKQQTAEALALKSRIEARSSALGGKADKQASELHVSASNSNVRHVWDPEPLLRLRQEDKSLQALSENQFAQSISKDRLRVLKRKYIAHGNRLLQSSPPGVQEPALKRLRTDGGNTSKPTQTNYDREVARGLSENEELLTQEEDVITKNRSQWAHLYRPRKPKHFNRVYLGYEWNKYNQTHYDHDNPPPKVVQGYRFNIFYPDLVDKTKGPTYKIERENGRRRGQTLAPAGENDTCLIRFVAGPPYEDIAFRIVDKEWDYSAKRDRGFRSSFDKGVLQLFFQFKKVYYRK